MKYKIDTYYTKKFNMITEDVERFLDGTKLDNKNEWLMPDGKLTTTDPQKFLFNLKRSDLADWFKENKIEFTALEPCKPDNKEESSSKRFITPQSRKENVEFWIKEVEPLVVKLTEEKVKEIEKKNNITVGMDQRSEIYWTYLEHITAVYTS